jgi:hypothetical protein
MVLPSSSDEPTLLGPVDRASLYRWTREEPSLETLWLKNIRTMDKVQITDPSTNVIISALYDVLSRTWIMHVKKEDVNHKLEGMWKEAVVVYLKLLEFTGITEDVHNNLSV